MAAEIRVDSAGVDQLGAWMKLFVPAKGIQGELFVGEPGETDESSI